MKPPLLFSLPLLASAAVALGAAKPDLAGTVLSGSGKPLANVTVFIYTAGRKLASGRSDRRATRIAARAPGRVLMEVLR